METVKAGQSAPANLPKFDEELTFDVLNSQVRRKLLVALAYGGPQTGADLRHVGKGERWLPDEEHITNCTLMHLKKMVDAGVVLKLDHGGDGRRVLYTLSPLVNVTRDGDETEFDFGFVVARLSADGD